ncbi:MAG: serine/threonine protein kinase [Deltaproteobacteria bacterium]|nr:serine/threonine protein kinase [Deltaproteobacteria bacterium]
MQDPLIGASILGQYHIIKLLGQGSMGKIYLAEQPSIDRLAAVKILHAGSTPAPDTRRRFHKEARAISRLAHPNIVTVYNFGELADGTLFLAMEYIEGSSLDLPLARDALSPLRALNIAHQCAAALAYAHSRQIIHRDFKPQNVMLTRLLGRDHIKVLDFGVARMLEEGGSTAPGAIVGTPRYLSPEQCRGEVATAQSDQYALGLVLYELLTGQPAIVADNAVGYIHTHQHAMPRPPSQVRPQPGLELLDSVVLRALAKRPEERFASVAELQQAIERLSDKVIMRSTAGKSTAEQQAVFAAQTQVDLVADGSNKQSAPTTRLRWIGAKTALAVKDYDALGRCGLQFDGGFSALDEFDSQPSAAFDVGVLCLADGWRETLLDLRTGGGLPPRTLVALNVPLSASGLTAAAELHNHLLLGQHPVEPTALALALRGMRRKDDTDLGAVLSQLVSNRAMQALQLSTAAQKSFYLDTLLDDLRAEGLRRPIQRAAREVAEEMITNALMHAPSRARSASDHGAGGLSGHQASLALAGEEPTLRWVVGDAFVALSIRDRFGTLTAGDVLRAVTGPIGDVKPPPTRVSGEHARPGADRVEIAPVPAGAGLGMRIMARAARHLVFSITAGQSCEVLALLEREPGASRHERSLCILQRGEPNRLPIGQRLWLTEQRRRGGVRLKLEGEINESCDLSLLFGRPEPVTLDLSGVISINSMGISLWIDGWRNRHPQLALRLEFCAPPMVSQFNLLPALSAAGQIVSIIAPYYCAGCCREVNEVLLVEEIADFEPPPRYCAQCNAELEFDERPRDYFAFLGG